MNCEGYLNFLELFINVYTRLFVCAGMYRRVRVCVWMYINCFNCCQYDFLCKLKKKHFWATCERLSEDIWRQLVRPHVKTERLGDARPPRWRCARVSGGRDAPTEASTPREQLGIFRWTQLRRNRFCRRCRDGAGQCSPNSASMRRWSQSGALRYPSGIVLIFCLFWSSTIRSRWIVGNKSRSDLAKGQLADNQCAPSRCRRRVYVCRPCALSNAPLDDGGPERELVDVKRPSERQLIFPVTLEMWIQRKGHRCARQRWPTRLRWRELRLFCSDPGGGGA